MNNLKTGINALKALTFLKPEHVSLGFEVIFEMLVVCDVCEPHVGKQLVPEKILQWCEKWYIGVKKLPEARIICHPHHLKVELPFQGSEQ